LSVQKRLKSTCTPGLFPRRCRIFGKCGKKDNLVAFVGRWVS
jgi:hypothetical protein